MIASSILAVALTASTGRVPVVVLPPVAPAAGAALAVALQERADELLAATGRAYLLHARQVNSMVARHQMAAQALAEPNVARQAAERLGAQRFVFSRLSAAPGGGWKLEITASRVGGPKSEQSQAELPAGEAAAVERGAAALAAAADLGAKPGAPATSSDAAMRAYATCDAALLAQPIGIETPPVLDEARLASARAACETAVQQDAKFAAARGGLALARAIAGEKVEAGAEGGGVNGVLARFWSEAHLVSPEAGEAVLRAELARDPGDLLALTYLGELYNATGRHVDAAGVWRQLAGISPDSPFVLSRLAYTEARLGKPAEAAKYAEQAVAFDPESVELQLELAGRYLDAGQVERALATLRPLAARADARPEAVLRLGYAQFLVGDLAGARASAQRAYGAAQDPGEWRTRARAKVDLARIAFKQGRKEEARTLLGEAQREGFTPHQPGPGDAELYALMPPRPASVARPKEAGPLASP